MSGRFHLVCRDCAFEGIYSGRGIAEDDKAGHDADFGHRTSLLDIEASASSQ